MKKKDVILILLLNILLFCIGAFIANATSTIISIPLGMLLMLIPFVGDCLFIEIIQIKALKQILRGKSSKRKKQKSNIFGKIIFLIVWSIILINLMLECYSAIIDLISGPKEIIMCDAQIKFSKVGRYKLKKYYLMGETSFHEPKLICIRGKKSRENITRLLEEDNKFRIYYFEKLNAIYNVQIYYN